MNTSTANQYDESFTMDRNFALEAVRVTEAAALACSHWVGKGDEKAADQAAVNAMREALNGLDINGTVVIGEGERDKAPMLYIGEKVGAGVGPAIDIALDPLEGTTICATAGPNSLAVLAMAEHGGFLHAPDVYMDKIAVGGGLPEGVVDLDASPKENLTNLAKAKGCNIADLTVIVLERDRHQDLIAGIREAGARVQLIGDGDVAAVIACASEETGADLYWGIGGAPEGVLAAAALRCIGGQFQGRLLFNDDEQRERAKRMGVSDLDKKYSMKELASGDVMFAATGVTDGSMLKGVKRWNGGAHTHSIIMRSKTGTVRTIEAEHNFGRKTWVDNKLMRFFPLLALLAINIAHPATAGALLTKDAACHEVRYEEIAPCYSAQTQRLEGMIDVVIQSYKDEIKSRHNNNEAENATTQLIASKVRFSDYKQTITRALYAYETGSIKRINAAAMVNRLTWEYFYHLLNFRCGNHLNVRAVKTYDLNKPETWCGKE